MSSNPPPSCHLACIQEVETPQNPEPTTSPKCKKGCKCLQSNADKNASKCQKGKEDESTLGDVGNDTVKSQGQQNKGEGKGRKKMAKKGETGSKQCVKVTDLIAHMY